MNWNTDALNPAKYSLIKNILAISFVVLIAGGSGYYFGYKTTFAQLNKEFQTKLVDKEKEQKSQEPQVQLVIKEVVGVQWIVPNQQPICDKDHTIKGKFGSNINNFYTKSQKNYDKIVPEICFANEEFAKDKAGFIKKF